VTISFSKGLCSIELVKFTLRFLRLWTPINQSC